MMNWVLVGIVIGTTVASDLLQSLEMKRLGEIQDFRPRGIGRLLGYMARRRYLAFSICFMAISFFAFMKLVTVADLSFAVPATAGSFAIETVLARVVLKERIDRRRWAGACLVACGVALLAH
jgi:drug/metabolite transporter (DMT)-like permease